MDQNFQLPPTHSLIVALDRSAGMAHPLPNDTGKPCNERSKQPAASTTTA